MNGNRHSKNEILYHIKYTFGEKFCSAFPYFFLRINILWIFARRWVLFSVFISNIPFVALNKISCNCKMCFGAFLVLLLAVHSKWMLVAVQPIFFCVQRAKCVCARWVSVQRTGAWENHFYCLNQQHPAHTQFSKHHEANWQESRKKNLFANTHTDRETDWDTCMEMFAFNLQHAKL